jgi:hypothetical protein
MSQEMVEKLLGRLLTDDHFRHRAVQSLAQSCREEGFFLSCEELDAIRREDLLLLGRVAMRLDKSIRRYSRRQTEDDASPVW